MRAVIQRVLSANASANDKVISEVGKGLCVLIGISRNDTKSDIEYIVKKILNLKLFEDNSGKRWSKSVKDLGGEILCLSQVTLYNSFKGNKLDFHYAMPPEEGKKFYYEFLDYIKKEYNSELIKEGIFGANLVIGIQNDGPVTITLESPTKEDKMESASSQTRLVKQDSVSSQTATDRETNCVCSPIEKNQTEISYEMKQDSASSQTVLIKQDSTSSQTRLIKQDSTSSQTINEVDQQMKDLIVDLDSKFSQTTNITQNNVSSQTC